VKQHKAPSTSSLSPATPPPPSILTPPPSRAPYLFAGATMAKSAAECVQLSDITYSMLSTPEAAKHVFYADDGTSSSRVINGNCIVTVSALERCGGRSTHTAYRQLASTCHHAIVGGPQPSLIVFQSPDGMMSLTNTGTAAPNPNPNLNLTPNPKPNSNPNPNPNPNPNLNPNPSPSYRYAGWNQCRQEGGRLRHA
jgi:hypothetical protein